MAKKKTNKVEEEVVVEETVIENVEPEAVVEEKPEVVGVVSNCTQLNVRKKATKSSDAVCVVNKGVELVIDESKSNNKWFKVTTKDGKEGFCMKDYVTIK